MVDKNALELEQLSRTVEKLKLETAKLQGEVDQKLDLEIIKLRREAKNDPRFPLLISMVSTIIAGFGLLATMISQFALLNRQSETTREDAFRSALQLATAQNGTADQRLAGMQRLGAFLDTTETRRTAATALTSTIAIGNVEGAWRMRCAAADILAGATNGRSNLAPWLYGARNGEAGLVTDLNRFLWTQIRTRKTDDGRPLPKMPEDQDDVALCTGSLAGTIRAVSRSSQSLADSDFSEVLLDYASLAGAKLANTSLRRATVRRVDLRGADLRGSDISGAIFTGSNFVGANLHGVTGFRSANFTYANIYRARLSPELLAYARRMGAVSISNEQWLEWRECKFEPRALRLIIAGALFPRPDGECRGYSAS